MSQHAGLVSDPQGAHRQVRENRAFAWSAREFLSFETLPRQVLTDRGQRIHLEFSPHATLAETLSLATWDTTSQPRQLMEPVECHHS